jgi:hypothetical protein
MSHTKQSSIAIPGTPKSKKRVSFAPSPRSPRSPSAIPGEGAPNPQAGGKRNTKKRRTNRMRKTRRRR